MTTEQALDLVKATVSNWEFKDSNFYIGSDIQRPFTLTTCIDFVNYSYISLHILRRCCQRKTPKAVYLYIKREYLKILKEMKSNIDNTIKGIE